MKVIKLILLVLVSLVLFSNTVAAPGLVNISPSDPTDNDALTCIVSGVEPENLDNYQYNWYVNGILDSGVDNIWTYPSSRTEVDDYIVCAVFTPLDFFLGLDEVTIDPEPTGPQPEDENNPPIVIILEPSNGDTFILGDVVDFNSIVLDLDFDPLAILWDFGDGSISIERDPSHQYSYLGPKTVTLTVNDGEYTVSRSITIYIMLEANAYPVAVIDASTTTPNEGELVIFDGSNSYDSDGEIVDYEWNFGDGTTSSDFEATHTYLVEGTYTVTLTVTDNDSLTDIDTEVIVVGDGNQPPVAVIDVPTTEAFLGFSLPFDGSGSYDPDGEVVSYEWNFDDGTTFSGVNVEHAFLQSRMYTVTLTVTDNDGETGTSSIVIDAGNVDRGPDYDRQGINPFFPDEMRDFRISRVMPLEYKLFYRKGESVPMLVKLVNEGGRDEVLGLTLRVPELNNLVNNMNNIHIEKSQVKWVIMNMNIPQYAVAGVHVARFNLMPTDSNDLNNIAYWSFIVA